MKNLKNLGEILSKEEQRAINGGYSFTACSLDSQCPSNWFCNGKHCVPCRYSTSPSPQCR
ncbi:MAG: hypothetical protein ACI8RP_000316 [Urechidicola sp.]|jgi:hypothetical protein